MSRSLGEVEALARKAARGCGYPWGLADEAGFALRWLEARGIPAFEPLAHLLDQADGLDLGSSAPFDLTAPKAQAGWLCPIQLGTALSDACLDPHEDTLVLERVRSAILLLPFLAHVSSVHNVALEVSSGEGRALMDGRATERLTVAGDWPLAPSKVALSIARDDIPAAPRNTRSDPDPKVWVALNRFAKRTYAPATETSRLTGAGAGLTDND